MRKLQLLVLILLLMCAMPNHASTYSGKCGTNITWTLDTSTGVLSIIGSGEISYYGDEPWRNYRSYVKRLEVSEGVTTVNGFRLCDNLTSIVLPSTVKSIVNYAFQGCTSLTSVTLPEGLTTICEGAFERCSNLASILIPNSVTNIGKSAFFKCANLSSIAIPEGIRCIEEGAFGGCSIESMIIPDSVTSIGFRAFTGCRSLVSVTLPESLTEISGCAFENCVKLPFIEIPSKVTSIGEQAFYGCDSLKHITVNCPIIWNSWFQYLGIESVTLGEDVKHIKSLAFYLCRNLSSINIPASVESIENGAFEDCRNLSFLNIFARGTEIAERAFTNCNKLTTAGPIGSGCNIEFAWNDTIPSGWFKHFGSLSTINIPEGVTSIEQDAFGECSKLVSISIPQSVTNIGNRAFSGCSSLTSIAIPENTTSIGKSVFSGCNSLLNVTIDCPSVGSWFKGLESIRSVTLGEKVTSIGDSAFRGCSSLTSITIPESVKSIGPYAFSGCSKLTSITIPEGVTSIGNEAFSGCGGLANVTINCPIVGSWFSGLNLKSVTLGEKVTNVENYAFGGCIGLTSITLPESVTSIGNSAFYGCSNLTSITIPEGMTSIGNNAFYGCSSLTSITIPESVTSIGISAFNGCSGLTSITLPESVTSIGESAFENCSSLTSINIPKSVTRIVSNVFYGCGSLISIIVDDRNAIYDSRNSCNGIIETESNTLVVGCKSTLIPSNVTRIGNYAFDGCIGLTSIAIPEGVTSIGDYTFYSCSNFSSITLPESVTNIGNNAFKGCPLSKVVNLSNCNISAPTTCKVYRRNDLINFTKSSFVYSNLAPVPEYRKGSAPFTASWLGTPSLEKNVGTYTANCKFHFFDEDLEFDANIPYSYTITPAPVIVNVNSTSREYGDANPDFDYTVNGLFGSDAIDVTLTAPDYRSKAGNYSFIASTTAKNYSVSNTTGTLTITKAPLTVSADSASKVYGDANPEFTAQYQGFKNEDDASAITTAPTISSEANVTSAVGEYAITATGGEAQNYEFTEYVPGTLTVTKAPLAIVADSVSRLYFEDAPEYTFSGKGWKNNEDASVLTALPTLQCAVEKATPAGVYDIVPSGAEAQNYEISYQNGSLTIGKRTLTVKAKDAERCYGEENPEFECSFDGFVNDDTADVLTTMPEAVTTAEQWSDVGSYSIVMQGGEATNYGFSYVSGKLSVLRAPQRIEWEQELGTVAVGSQVLLTAKATSGLEIEFKYDAELAEIYPTFDGLVLDCLKEGVLTIRATQDGNQNYHPAERVVKTINIVSTGIASVIQEGEDAIYDLQGRKVLEAVKGFYLQNGKKVYRK